MQYLGYLQPCCHKPGCVPSYVNTFCKISSLTSSGIDFWAQQVWGAQLVISLILLPRSNIDRNRHINCPWGGPAQGQDLDSVIPSTSAYSVILWTAVLECLGRWHSCLIYKKIYISVKCDTVACFHLGKSQKNIFLKGSTFLSTMKYSRDVPQKPIMLLKLHIIILRLVHFSLWTAAPGWVKGFWDPISIILCPSPWEICLICNFQPTFHRCQQPQQDVFRGHVRKGWLNVRSWYEICNQLFPARTLSI